MSKGVNVQRCKIRVALNKFFILFDYIINTFPKQLKELKSLPKMP